MKKLFKASSIMATWFGISYGVLQLFTMNNIEMHPILRFIFISGPMFLILFAFIRTPKKPDDLTSKIVENLPSSISNETALQESVRRRKESPSEQIKRPAEEASPLVPVSIQNPTKAPPTAYCVKCKVLKVIVNPNKYVMRNGTPSLKGSCPECGTQMYSIGANGQMDDELPIPFTLVIAGNNIEFEYTISARELINKGKRKRS